MSNELPEVKKTIDGIEFTTVKFSARQGFTLSAQLLKHVAPLLEGDASQLSKNVPLHKLFASMDITGALDTIVALMSTTYCNKRRIDENEFDRVFSGKYTTMYKVLAWIVEVNSFLGEVSIGDLLAKQVPNTMLTNG